MKALAKETPPPILSTQFPILLSENPPSQSKRNNLNLYILFFKVTATSHFMWKGNSKGNKSVYHCSPSINRSYSAFESFCQKNKIGYKPMLDQSDTCWTIETSLKKQMMPHKAYRMQEHFKESSVLKFIVSAKHEVLWTMVSIQRYMLATMRFV